MWWYLVQSSHVFLDCTVFMNLLKLCTCEFVHVSIVCHFRVLLCYSWGKCTFYTTAFILHLWLLVTLHKNVFIALSKNTEFVKIAFTSDIFPFNGYFTLSRSKFCRCFCTCNAVFTLWFCHFEHK